MLRFFRGLCGGLCLWLFCWGVVTLTTACAPAKPKPQKTDKVVQVGIDLVWYPVDFQGKNQDFNQFARELTTDIFGTQGARVVWVEEAGGDLYASLSRKAVDAIITAREAVGPAWRSYRLLRGPPGSPWRAA